MGKSKTPPDPKPPTPNAPDAGDQEGLNPRRALFEKFYRNGGPDFRPGNAYRSAMEAGYTTITAKANCHILARRCNIKTAEALEALGCNGFSQATKLLELREAKTVRWNPNKFPAQRKTKKRPARAARGGWDVFDDGHIQLEATKEINRILDVYPAPKPAADDGRPVHLIFPSNFKSLEVKSHDDKAKA